MKISLITPISVLGSVGKITAMRLEKIGIKKTKDLLFHFPTRYDDFTKTIKIENINSDEQVTFIAKIEQITSRRSFGKRKMTIIEAVVSDDTGSIKVLWFNQFFIIKHLAQGDKIIFSGKANLSKYGVQIMSPVYEKLSKEEKIHTGGLVPIYPTTLRLSQKQLRYLIKVVLPLAKHIEDFIPLEITSQEKLISLREALEKIHFPKNKDDIKLARQRLSFDEMLIIQLITLLSKKESEKHKAVKIQPDNKKIDKFVNQLPFCLTTSQEKAKNEILSSLTMDKPMNRLLEGDVGSGKTIISIIAMLSAGINKIQSAIMVPTEILAWQHYLSLSEILKKQHLHIAIFTNSIHSIARGINGPRTINRKRILEELAAGKIDIIIGTHSLIQEKIIFNNLGLAIIDEQHRFGVAQRKKLIEKSGDTDTQPHFLSMTATPIPRSLALSLYGDLDISIIDELPQGRKDIITKIVAQNDRTKAYKFIKEKVNNGEQVFIICPLIEESDKLGVKSVKQEYEKLKNEIFPEFKIGILHGKMKQSEKEEIMAKFKNNKINILTATSVVEVGVDIPNATIMVIEDAQRFGLAQLHQFRGRVGRSDKQSYCFIFSESTNEITQKRLQALTNSNDGFELSQMDLELRGPGEMFGIKQSGIPTLKIASFSDISTIKKTSSWAQKIITDKKLFNHTGLNKKIQQNVDIIHLE